MNFWLKKTNKNGTFPTNPNDRIQYILVRRVRLFAGTLHLDSRSSDPEWSCHYHVAKNDRAVASAETLYCLAVTQCATQLTSPRLRQRLQYLGLLGSPLREPAYGWTRVDTRARVVGHYS